MLLIGFSNGIQTLCFPLYIAAFCCCFLVIWLENKIWQNIYTFIIQDHRKIILLCCSALENLGKWDFLWNVVCGCSYQHIHCIYIVLWCYDLRNHLSKAWFGLVSSQQCSYLPPQIWVLMKSFTFVIAMN